eukprot:5141930-Pyramimonas_sp.AAC.1
MSLNETNSRAIQERAGHLAADLRGKGGPFIGGGMQKRQKDGNSEPLRPPPAGFEPTTLRLTAARSAN